MVLTNFSDNERCAQVSTRKREMERITIIRREKV
jgi:hypothetical protein